MFDVFVSLPVPELLTWQQLHLCFPEWAESELLGHRVQSVLEDRVKPGNVEEQAGGSVGRHETLQVSFLFTAALKYYLEPIALMKDQ